MMKHICTAFLLAFVGVLGVAQESAAPSVAIPLIASDSHRRPIRVTVDSLVITDQKTRVTTASLVRGADLPLELGVLIDASSSQRSADLNDILKSAEHFISEVIHNEHDRVFILQFSANPQATEWLTREQWQRANVKISIGGGTALYDAVATACKERMGPLDRQKPSRRILVLISDGEDNQSHVTREAAALEALRAGAVIFTIDTDLSGMSYRGLKIMGSLAEVTGGESFTQVGRKEIPKVLTNITGMIDGMYYLTYVPPEAWQSAVHEVEVHRAPKEKFKLSYAKKYLWKQ
jgi:Ca-activated chloride channel family protein